MMRRLRSFVLLMALLGTLLVPVSTQAAGLFPDVCSGGSASQSAVCKDQTTQNPLTGPNGTLMKVTQLIAVLAGIIAVIVIIIAGLQYVMSGGDSAKIGAAKNTIIYVLIGLVVIALAGSIVSFVLSRI